MTLAVNGRYLGQAVTGVQRYARETVKVLDSRGLVTVLRPNNSESPARARLWELTTLPRQAARMTGSYRTLNLCNWGPVHHCDSSVVVIHDVTPLQLPGAFSRSYRAAFRSYLAVVRHSNATVVTVSSDSRSKLERLLGRSVAVAPCGVNLEGARAATSGPLPRLDALGLAAQSYALFIGGHDPRKNVTFAMRLRPVLANLGLKLVVTRREVAASFADEASTLWSNADLVLSSPSDTELWQLYAGAALLLHPSEAEGFGLPMLEAYAAGTPFVSSPVGAASELAIAPYQVVPLDTGAWGEAIRLVLRDRSGLSAAGQRRARDYSWESTARILLEVVARS